MLATEKLIKREKKKNTYNVLDVLAREMQVGEFHEVVWEGEFSALLQVVSRFSNQVQGQVHHGASPSTPSAAPANHSAGSSGKLSAAEME